MTDKTRLDQILALAGYDRAPLNKPHWKTNLVSQIGIFASLNQDAELEAQCEAELERMRSLIERRLT